MTRRSRAEARRKAMLRGETPTPTRRYVEELFARRPPEVSASVTTDRGEWRITESGDLELRLPDRRKVIRSV